MFYFGMTRSLVQRLQLEMTSNQGRLVSTEPSDKYIEKECLFSKTTVMLLAASTAAVACDISPADWKVRMWKALYYTAYFTRSGKSWFYFSSWGASVFAANQHGVGFDFRPLIARY